MSNPEQDFLNALDNKLWKAADKLRSNLDAANYKHIVLGLIFLKYVSDAFEQRQEELLELCDQFIERHASRKQYKAEEQRKHISVYG